MSVALYLYPSSVVITFTHSVRVAVRRRFTLASVQLIFMSGLDIPSMVLVELCQTVVNENSPLKQINLLYTNVNNSSEFKIKLSHLAFYELA